MLSQDNVVFKRKMPVEFKFYGFFCYMGIYIRAKKNKIKGDLILHSDQGSQFTSKAFGEFCESVHVTQSMSKAGYPYDNAPMECYFNTLKNECTNLHDFKTEESLYQTVEEFAYVKYNYVRPRSFNDYATLHEVRVAA